MHEPSCLLDLLWRTDLYKLRHWILPRFWWSMPRYVVHVSLIKRSEGTSLMTRLNLYSWWVPCTWTYLVFCPSGPSKKWYLTSSFGNEVFFQMNSTRQNSKILIKVGIESKISWSDFQLLQLKMLLLGKYQMVKPWFYCTFSTACMTGCLSCTDGTTCRDLQCSSGYCYVQDSSTCISKSYLPSASSATKQYWS